MNAAPGPPEVENLRRLVHWAREEDLDGGDATCALLEVSGPAEGRFVARQELVFCGGALLAEVAAAYDPAIETAEVLGEGRSARAGEVLARWRGPAASILAAERVALNFLQRLGGIATETRRYVDAVAGTGARVYDTRKTTPGWRALEKYAVRVGGARNHRMGLYDALLVKDNHLAALERAGGDALSAVADRLGRADARRGGLALVQVEVADPERLPAALKLPVDALLLDNMTENQLRAAVALRDEAGLKGRVELEASGGITLENVRRIAETGVDRISVGAITHSAPAADLAMEVTV